MLRALLFALAVLLLASVAGAVDEDVRCVVYSDSCSGCLAAGCGWCSEGFCSALKSDICAADKIASQCSSERKSRQQILCDQYSNCTQCAAAGCFVCVDTTYGAFKCRSGSQNPYGSQNPCTAVSAYDTQLFSMGVDLPFTFVDTAGQQCPAPLTPPANAPVMVQVMIVSSTNVDPQQFQLYVVNLLAAVGITVPANTIILLNVTYTAGKRQSLHAVVTFTFADSSTSGYSSGQLGSAYQQSVAAGNAPAGTLASPPVVVSGTVVPVILPGTQSPAVGGGGSEINMSRGALAGIIIGCLIAGMVIIAIIAFLVMRKREQYPLPFRSPAAAYRP